MKALTTTRTPDTIADVLRQLLEEQARQRDTLDVILRLLERGRGRGMRPMWRSSERLPRPSAIGGFTSAQLLAHALHRPGAARGADGSQHYDAHGNSGGCVADWKGACSRASGWSAPTPIIATAFCGACGFPEL